MSALRSKSTAQVVADSTRIARGFFVTTWFVHFSSPASRYHSREGAWWYPSPAAAHANRLASDSIKCLPQEKAAILRVELAKLGEALQVQIAGIIEVRRGQLTGGSASPTLH
jgi:hypothetical protein